MKNLSVLSCVLLLITGLFTQGCEKKKDIINNAKKEAEKIINDAKEEAEGYVLRGRGELYKLYPNLKKYEPGINVVDEEYIKSFSIYGNMVKIEMYNGTRSNIKPNANIIFLNRQGFITNNYTLLWVFSSIKPGETRVDEKNIRFNYGKPVYYSVWFSQ